MMMTRRCAFKLNFKFKLKPTNFKIVALLLRVLVFPSRHFTTFFLFSGYS